MQKCRPGIISILSAALILLAMGVNFLSHTKLFTPYRMVLVGTVDSNNPEQTNIYAQITENTNPTIIDDIEHALTYAEPMSNIPELPKDPDLYIAITSPRSSTILCEFNLWQQDDSLIIQLRQGEDWSDSIFKRADDVALLETLQNL